jgi:hypothetical protein
MTRHHTGNVSLPISRSPFNTPTPILLIPNRLATFVIDGIVPAIRGHDVPMKRRKQ